MSATPRIWRPRYEGDEVALGLALGVALHALPVVAIALKVMLPGSAPIDEKPLVSKPVIAASLLKLGQPLDPKRLPDRLVPQRRTAPKKEIVASRDDPAKKTPDAGPPPPNADDSDIQRLIAKTDPFAEDAGKTRPEEGHAAGVEAGLETDPNKVRAGDMYAALLQKWFHERWTFPSFISQAEANKLCVRWRMQINRDMTLFYVASQPTRASGNEHFDESAHSMLQKIQKDNTPLPTPPAELDSTFRGKSVELVLAGGSGGDSSRCR